MNPPTSIGQAYNQLLVKHNDLRTARLAAGFPAYTGIARLTHHHRPAYLTVMDTAVMPAMPAKAFRHGKPAKRSQILAMQRELLNQVMSPTVDPARKAQCATAYERLEERLRILKGDPLPGSLRPESKRKAKQAAAVTPIERVNGGA